MKYFIKISAIFLAFFFLCSPLSAADDVGDDIPEVLQVRAFTYIATRDIWKLEYENGTVHGVKLKPEATKELLRQIEEEKEKKRQESELPRDQDYARDVAGGVKIFAQTFLPLGVPLTTGTSLLGEHLFGTSTLTEGAIKSVCPMKPIKPVFEGSRRVPNLAGTYRIVNLDLCKPQNMRSLHKGQLAPTLPQKSLTTSFVGGGVPYVEFLMSEDQAFQESTDALWEMRTVEVKGKEEKEPHYIIVHSNSGQLLTYAKAVWRGPWSGYYCSVQPYPEILEKRFLWDIYYHEVGKVHLLKNIGCYPGLLCYANDLSQNGPYGQVLIQSIASQFNVEDYYLTGSHRPSIEFRLSRDANYSKPSLPPSLALSNPSEKPPFENPQNISLDEDPYTSPDEGDKNEGDNYLIEEVEELFDMPLTFQEGFYQIRNCDLSSLAKNPNRNHNAGLLLPIMSKPSQSGYYTGILDASHSELYKVPHLQNFWQVYPAEEQGYFTIKNYAGELLTWVNKSTYSGFYGQILGDNTRLKWLNSYPDERAKYELNGEFRNDVLWELKEVYYDFGLFYTLKNKGGKFMSDDEGGFLCYTSDLSPIGPYMQVLDSSTKYFQQDKEKYKPEGEFYSSILWRLSKVDPPPSLSSKSEREIEDFKDLLEEE